MRLRSDLLFWVEIEATGPDPLCDWILEIAVQLTDYNLISVADARSWVIHWGSEALTVCGDDPVYRMGARSELLRDMVNSCTDLFTVESALMQYFDKYVIPGTAHAAGRSVHCAVEFLCYQMPRVYERLHDCQLNVSSIAQWVQWALGHKSRGERTHRATSNLVGSLAEMRELAEVIKGATYARRRSGRTYKLLPA